MFPKELLLGLLAGCCCGAEAVCVVKAQVSGSVTLEWKIPSEMSLGELEIMCVQKLNSSRNFRVLYLQRVINHNPKNGEDLRLQEQHFGVRVRVRVERVRGLFRMNISDLSVEDSGSYRCTFYNRDTGQDSDCQLSVSDAPGPTQGPTDEPPEGAVAWSGERTGLYSALGLLLGLVLLIFALKIKSVCSTPQKHQTNQAEVV